MALPVVLLVVIWTMDRSVMGRISIDITDEEGKAIKSMLPALDKMRAFIPSQLLSVVHKLEQALKEL